MCIRLIAQACLLLLVTAFVLELPARPALGATLPPDFAEANALINPAISFPTTVAFTPDGRMLVGQHSGTLKVFDVAQNYKSLGDALSLAARICSNSERGLLGLAVDPNFSSNKYVYLYYTFKNGSTCPIDSQPVAGTTYPINRVARFTLDSNGANKINPNSELILIDNILSVAANHNGGDLHFGPDGNLYIAVGDGGCDPYDKGGCAENNKAARDKHTLMGKILRIRPDGTIPADNPFTGANSGRCNVTGRTTTGNHCQETFAWGLRNPFRMSFKPGTDEFYINDVGQRSWEEINASQKGADYGWNDRDGFCAREGYYSLTGCRTTPLAVVNGQTDPLLTYPHPEVKPSGYSGPTGKSVTGGAFVPTDSGWPAEYIGDYLFGDYVAGWIYRLDVKPNGSSEVKPFAENLGKIIELKFGPAPGGSKVLYVVTHENKGQLKRLSFSGTAANLPPTAVLSANPTAGPSPLRVSFSASGSADPNSGDTLSYVWNFGDASPTLTSTLATVVHTYTQAGIFTATLVVRDQQGAASQPATLRIDVDNLPPEPGILAPAPGTTYTVGQQIVLEGAASDPEDGQLAGEQLTWEVIRHHDDHTHPWLGATSGFSVTILGPPPEDLLAPTNSYLEIVLTAVDSRGLTSVITRELRPQLVHIMFASEPTGARLILGSVPVTAPYTLVAIPWQNLLISAPPQDALPGSPLVFERWSHGGEASQTLTIAATPATFTAIFRPRATVPEPVVFVPLLLGP
jgi:glucose/arabinose dehydrogenase